MKPEDYVLQSNLRRDLREQELHAQGYNPDYVREKIEEEFGK